jgi:hypothetical protein
LFAFFIECHDTAFQLIVFMQVSKPLAGTRDRTSHWLKLYQS